MPVTVKAYHLTGEFAQLCLSVPELFLIITDSQTIDVVKGIAVRYVVCGSNDYLINFILMHNVARSRVENLGTTTKLC